MKQFSALTLPPSAFVPIPFRNSLKARTGIFRQFEDFDYLFEREMFLQVAQRVAGAGRSLIWSSSTGRQITAAQTKLYSSKAEETDEQFDARWEAYFNKPEIDDWELRRGLNELHGHDLVPEPKIVVAALKACRRLNDSAMCVRLLEALKDKAGSHKNIYPYILQEIRPTLDELGISTPEELGLDKPDPSKC